MQSDRLPHLAALAGLAMLMLLASLFFLTGSTERATAASDLGGGVKGKVSTPAGLPIVGALVAFSPRGKGFVPDIAILTGRSGTYRGPTLHRGKYRITITKKGFSAASKDVLIQNGKITIVNFTLRPRTERTLHGVPWSGSLRGDVEGDGRSDWVELVYTGARGRPWRFFLRVHSRRSTLTAPVRNVELPKLAGLNDLRQLKIPRLLLLVALDRRRGPEIAVAVSEGAANVFPVFFAVRGRSLERLQVEPRLPQLTYGGSVTLPVGLDCSLRTEPGTLVFGSAWRRGVDRGPWQVERRFYRLEGDLIRQVRVKRYRGASPERFHEFRDRGGARPFPSCASARTEKAR